jgi:hypothetical protein
LIFMGRFRCEASVEVEGSGWASVPGKIVTGRHNEYTILADVSSPAGESAIQVWD